MEWALHRLGLLYKSQGIAEKMYQRALQGKEKAWSLDRRLGDAEKMYLRVLQGKEKAWGPSTQNTVNNLGLLQGKLDKAEKMYQWALSRKGAGIIPPRIRRPTVGRGLPSLLLRNIGAA
jgi:hypothetical protein